VGLNVGFSDGKKKKERISMRKILEERESLALLVEEALLPHGLPFF